MVILELTVDVTDLQNASSICAGCIMHTGQTDDALGANARCVFADKALMSIKGCYIILTAAGLEVSGKHVHL